ncbi:hypothetical protein [Salinilacihabitans rarus]|uniref:hypothetical protein n=1 Tax=Salinilacihabitans rarus TaxID=2961596 RepID=UPI0020C88AF0|nr:hypothetical protein [Salinilacihabitans rarus]
MPESSDPRWRYGVALFPLPPLLQLVASAGLTTFASVDFTSTTGSEGGVLVGIVAFALIVLGSWSAVVLSAAVAASLYLDARAIARHERDAPSRFLAGGVGVVYVAAGADLPFLYAVSVPAIAYYLYRRRRYVPL